jgi:cob(I)alamin adenosyltransferase
MMSIVTRTGDKGTTGLFGAVRVPKHAQRLQAYGTVDELNAMLGVLLAESSLPEHLKHSLTEIQHLLFRIGADLATPLEQKTPVPRVTKEHVEMIDFWIGQIEPGLPQMTSFILPGGTAASARLHHARTVCRRAEREVSALLAHEAANREVLVFLNRLGDYLFLAAREANRAAGVPDVPVRYDHRRERSA